MQGSVDSVQKHSYDGRNSADGTGKDQVDGDGCLSEAVEPKSLNDCK